MSPELAAAAILGLGSFAILAVGIHMLSWISETVLPEMWEIGEDFGIYPSKGEILHRKFVQASGVVLRIIFLLMVISLFV